MRKVTPLTRKRAFATIKIVAKAMRAGEIAISYSDLASRLQMLNETGRGLGQILDEVAFMCKERGLPNISAVVVTKDSLLAGAPFPSRESFNSQGFWPISGIFLKDVPREQERVRSFDWASVRELGLQGTNKQP